MKSLYRNVVIVYLDVIFLINFIINFLIILITGFIVKEDGNLKRYIISAITGSLFVVIFTYLAINVRFIIRIIQMIISGVIMVIIAYNEWRIKEIIFKLTILCMTGFGLGGVFLAINENNFINTIINSISRKSVFKQYNILFVILVSVLVAALTTIIIYIFRLRILKKEILYSISIKYKNEKYSYVGIVDTGNSLREPFSKKPVCVAEADIVRKNINFIMEGILIVPYRAVGVENGFLYAFKADELIIKSNEDEANNKVVKGAIVALYDGKLSSDGTYNLLLHKEQICI